MIDMPLLNHHVVAVIENEWAQLRRNRVALFTILAPPVLLLSVGLAILLLVSLMGVTGDRGGYVSGWQVPQHAPGTDAPANSIQLVRNTLLNPLLALFQVIPLVVPMTIASYSVVGEKQSRSLEALLATPVHTWELLLGKALAAALPALLATWLSFDIFAVAARLWLDHTRYSDLIVSPAWLLTMILVTPLLTMLAVEAGIIISSRVKEAQSAQQLSSIIILPVLATLVGQMAGVVNVSVGFVLAAGVVIGLADTALLFIAVRLFNRETILTTWR